MYQENESNKSNNSFKITHNYVKIEELIKWLQLYSHWELTKMFNGYFQICVPIYVCVCMYMHVPTIMYVCLNMFLLAYLSTCIYNECC